QHPHPRRALSVYAWRWRNEPKPRMQRGTRRGQQITETGDVDGVVGVAAIGRAAPSGDEVGIAQLREMVRDQVRGLTHQARQLMHHQITPGERAEQPPAQRMPRKLQERWRGELLVRLLRHHTSDATSTWF